MMNCHQAGNKPLPEPMIYVTDGYVRRQMSKCFKQADIVTTSLIGRAHT